MTPSKQLGGIQIKEPQVAIRERAHHVRFELMHRQENTLLFGHEELLGVFQIVHVPQFYLTISGCSCDLVVLIKRVKLILFFFNSKFTGSNILEFSRTYGMLWVVAIF